MSPAFVTVLALVASFRRAARDTIADAACELGARLLAWGWALDPGAPIAVEQAPSPARSSDRQPVQGYAARAGALHRTRDLETTLCGDRILATMLVTSSPDRWEDTPLDGRCQTCDRDVRAHTVAKQDPPPEDEAAIVASWGDGGCGLGADGLPVEDAAPVACPDAGRCHGCLSWCDSCGDVSAVCDDPVCDQHRAKRSAPAPAPIAPEARRPEPAPSRYDAPIDVWGPASAEGDIHLFRTMGQFAHFHCRTVGTNDPVLRTGKREHATCAGCIAAADAEQTAADAEDPWPLASAVADALRAAGRHTRAGALEIIRGDIPLADCLDADDLAALSPELRARVERRHAAVIAAQTAADVADPRSLARAVALAEDAILSAEWPTLAQARGYLAYFVAWPALPAPLRARVERYRAAVASFDIVAEELAAADAVSAAITAQTAADLADPRKLAREVADAFRAPHGPDWPATHDAARRYLRSLGVYTTSLSTELLARVERYVYESYTQQSSDSPPAVTEAPAPEPPPCSICGAAPSEGHWAIPHDMAVIAAQRACSTCAGATEPCAKCISAGFDPPPPVAPSVEVFDFAPGAAQALRKGGAL